jgi:hypothetical protein
MTREQIKQARELNNTKYHNGEITTGQWISENNRLVIEETYSIK